MKSEGEALWSWRALNTLLRHLSLLPLYRVLALTSAAWHLFCILKRGLVNARYNKERRVDIVSTASAPYRGGRICSRGVTAQ